MAPGESYETRDGWSVSVENVAVQIAFVEFGTVHHDPEYADGEQFVLADVEVSGSNAPDPTDLLIYVTTDTLERTDRLSYAAADVNSETRQRVALPVPVSPPPNEGAIVWEPDEGESVSWTLPESVLTAIANPPEFELREFEARDVPGDEIEATLTVENTGSGDGAFVAEVGDAEFSDQDEVRIEVDAGETVTETRRVFAPLDGDETTVVLRWRDTTIERTVRNS